MFNTVIVFIIAVFFLIGIFDKVFTKGKLGFAAEMEAGVGQVAGLILSLVGIMCFAPLLGKALSPILTPIYNLVGADPANFPGIVLGPDGGAFALAQSMTNNEQVMALSGLYLASMLGVTVCFSLPFSLGVVDKKDHKVLSQGMLAGIIVSPFATIIGGLISGFSIGFILRSLFIAFIIVILLVIGIIRHQDRVVKGFTIFSRIISACALLSLGFACFQLLTGIRIVPVLDEIGTKFTVVGTMGITVAGALCMISFLRRILKKPFEVLGKALKINDTAILGIVLSVANAMPVYAMVKDMDERGKLMAIAFSTPACYALGAHLAYTTTVMPQYIGPMVATKIIGGILAMIVAWIFFGKSVKEKESGIAGNAENAAA